MSPAPGKLLMRLPDLGLLPPLPPTGRGIRLRQAAAGDEEALAAILRSAFADDRWTPGLVRRVLVEAADVAAVWLVEVDGRPAATASSRLLPERFPGSGYLHWVGTHHEHLRCGLGRLASLAALHELRRLGCRDGVLETDDRRHAAIVLYLGMGFAPEPPDEAQRRRWAAVMQAVGR